MRKYFMQEGKTIATLIAVALLIAFILEFAYPFFIETLPHDLFGFTFKEGITTASAMDKLIGMK